LQGIRTIPIFIDISYFITFFVQKYDYIIIGTGASGLMLAYYMMKDSFFDQK